MLKYVKSSNRALFLLEKQCFTMTQLKQIQSHLTVSGSVYDPYAAAKIINFCAISTSGDLHHAHLFFLRLPHKTTFIFNTMIRAFSQHDQHYSSLLLYKQMLLHTSQFSPNNYTFSFVLTACAHLADSQLGFAIHSQIIRFGWEGYDFVQNGLIHLYATCDCMDAARKLFDISCNKDVITWTALINGYVKSNEVSVARQLFDEMPEKNAVSWSAMITGYAQVGLFKEALELFNDMQLSGFRPNHAGIVGALTACAFLGALDQGKWIHAYVERNKMEMDRVLGTALVDMYAKCGCIDIAAWLFEEMPIRDVYAFTSLISGLANHNESAAALQLFYRMQKDGVTPNEVTFICVLSACGRMGLVEEGLGVIKSMKDSYGIETGVEHYGCLVDLLGRAGMLEEAKRVVKEMPMEADSYILGALLNACGLHGDVESGTETVKCLVDRSLDHGGVHVSLSNMYAWTKHWPGVARIRKGMEERKVRKVPGCSSIELDGMVYEFVAGDKSHVFRDDVVLLFLGMNKNLRSFSSHIDDVSICLMS